MIETAVALAFTHFAVDFLIQPDGVARARSRAGAFFLLHIAIVTALAWAVLGYPPAWSLLGLFAASHAAIDLVRLRWGGASLAGFLAGQATHLAAIALLASLWPETWGAGIWAQPATLTRLPWLDTLPTAYVLGAGLIATVWAGGQAVGALMARILTVEVPKGLPSGGLIIGRLERLMILILILMGQPGGIGFLITAKSILRFGEVTGQKDEGRTGQEGIGYTNHLISEYVIIGTLASFAWALATASATDALLTLLSTGP